MFFTFCMVLSFVPATTFAAQVKYIKNVNVSYDQIYYNNGEAPRGTASVPTGEGYEVAYEYWREIHQESPGSVWTGTGRYWYSDESKMAGLASDKRIDKFEAGNNYSYNIVLKTTSDSADSLNLFDDKVDVTVGGYNWGTPDKNTNLEISDMSRKLYIYSPYSMYVPHEGEDKSSVINDIEIANAKLSYNAGGKPRATAEKSGLSARNYDIYYECWEQMETDSMGKAEPVAFWYSNNEKNDEVAEGERITSFIEGKTYMYSIELKAKGDKTFAPSGSGLKMSLNGEKIDAIKINVTEDGKTLYATALKTIRPSKPVEKTPIELIEISGATTTFKVGDKPIFTGRVPEGALYYIDHEGWSSEDAGITSSDFWNNRYGDFEKSWGKLLTSFQSGQEYTYRLYVKLTDEAVDAGYYFDKDKTKLSINGKIMDMPEDSIDIDPERNDVAWFWYVFSMTPEEAGGSGTTGESQGTDETDLPKKSDEAKTSKDGSDKVESTLPKTGDANSMLLWASLSAASVLAMVMAIFHDRKKKCNI